MSTANIIIGKNNNALNYLTSVETSQILKKLGASQNGAFIYKDGDSECRLFTYEELCKYIPFESDWNVENVFYKAEFTNYTEIDKEEAYYISIDAKPTNAGLDKDNEYVARIHYKGNVIAFSKTKDGKYRNLIAFSFSVADAVGKLVINLVEEECKIIF